MVIVAIVSIAPALFPIPFIEVITMRQHYKPAPKRHPVADALFAVSIGLFFAVFLFFNL